MQCIFVEVTGVRGVAFIIPEESTERNWLIEVLEGSDHSIACTFYPDRDECDNWNLFADDLDWEISTTGPISEESERAYSRIRAICPIEYKEYIAVLHSIMHSLMHTT